MSDAADPLVRVAATLTSAEVDGVLRLVAAARAADGGAPLSDHGLLRLHDSGPHLLLERDRALLGYAQVEAADGETVAELLVAPDARGHGLGAVLVEAVIGTAGGGGPLRVWSHGHHPAAAALAARYGFTLTRELYQLRRSLTGPPLPEPELPAGVAVRTFEVGRDEAAWVEVNATAFAHHPEQGRWTARDVEAREREAWFDPAGFFLAERDGRLVGFHWTKVHTDPEAEPIGEVYVVGVLPEESGHGLGRTLTLIGLRYLADRGLSAVLLYVDGDNAAARRVYEKLGFTLYDADLVYSRGG